MNPRIAAIGHEIRHLEEELELEFARRRTEFAYSVRDRVVHFEERVLKRHRDLRRGILRYVLSARPLFLLTAPLIYSLIVPFLLLDFFVTLYQRVCFPVYGVAVVKRSDYLVFDRAHLAYLNAVERLNCAYCSYANGLIAYVREVAARSEQYWCPIKHARRIMGAHERYNRFSDYGDAEAYQQELEALRAELKRRSDLTA
ncbi:MAG: hypothetical protein ABL964_06295 [Steroidobacteraceae bacterium]